MKLLVSKSITRGSLNLLTSAAGTEQSASKQVAIGTCGKARTLCHSSTSTILMKIESVIRDLFSNFFGS